MTSPFPGDILALINDTTPGSGSAAEPSTEVVEQRKSKLTVEDVAALREETEAELAGDVPVVEHEPLTDTDLDMLYAGAFR